MSIIRTVFFWTGAAVWIVIIGIVIGIACLAVSQWWNRKGSISAGNILFGLFGPVFYRHFDCYKAWDRISHTPALHRDCLRRHNNFRRFAYKRLVWEARRQKNRQQPTRDGS